MKHLTLFLIFGVSVGSLYSRPNIVLLYIDDLGWADVGYTESKFYSPSFYETPNIDRLAAEGMVFNQAYANAGNCAPSRAALMSGQYAPRTGIYTVNNSDRSPASKRKIIPTPNTLELETNAYTLGEALNDAGYATAHIGKWHLGEGTLTGPLGQGFDVNIGGYATGSPPNGYFCPWNAKAVGLETCSDGEYLTDRLTDEAVAFIADQKDSSFFLYLAHYGVHTPLQAKQEIINKYQTKPKSGGHTNETYAAMIESVDQSVLRILDTLSLLGMDSNTLVIFYSDNGGHAGATSNHPLRAVKGTLYEGGIRVPFAVRWPGTIRAGSESEVPVIGTDLFPTFLELAEAVAPQNKVLDGESLTTLFSEIDDLRRQSLFWHYPVYLEGSGDGGGKTGFRSTPVGAIRKGDYKLLEYFEYGQLELYNLKEDLSEQNNLALTMPNKVAELYNEMLDWRENTSAPVPVDPNPAFVSGPDEPDTSEYVTWGEIEPLVTGIQFQRKTSYKFSISKSGNARLEINYQLSKASDVELKLIDIRGVERIIQSKRRMAVGLHTFSILPEEKSNGEIVSGVYFLAFEIDGKRALQKVSLL